MTHYTSRILHDSHPPPFTSTYIEVLGSGSLYGPHARTRHARQVMVRVVANHPRKSALAMFSREITPAGTFWAPGTTSPGGGRPPVSPLIKPFSFTLDKLAVNVAFVLDGERHAVPVLSGVADSLRADRGATGGRKADPACLCTQRRQGQHLHHRLDRATPERQALPWDRVTPEAVQAHFSHIVHCKVDGFYRPGTASMKLLLHEALDGGGPSLIRVDPLGKGMAQILLDMSILVPKSIVASV